MLSFKTCLPAGTFCNRDSDAQLTPATAHAQTLAVIATMRHLLIILFFCTATVVYPQTTSLFGVYQANWGGPSSRHLILDCDSTYRFVTHWDFGGKIDVEPPIDDKKKWRVEGLTKVVLEIPQLGIKSFDIQADGKLYHKVKRQSNTWTRTIIYDQDCSVSEYIEVHSSSSYTLTRFLPGLVILTSERFNNDKLEERISYYTLTKQETDTLRGFKTREYPDPVLTVKVKIATCQLFWPQEKVERWEKGIVTTSFFDKKGQLIKKE